MALFEPLFLALNRENPIPFEELYRRSELFELAATSVRVASIPDLIALKRQADRPQDRLDVEVLLEIQRRRERS